MDDKIIEIKNVSKSYNDKPVVKKISLSIRRGEFVTLQRRGYNVAAPAQAQYQHCFSEIRAVSAS